MNHFSHDTVACDALRDVSNVCNWSSLSEDIIWSRVTYNEQYLAVVDWILTAVNCPFRCLAELFLRCRATYPLLCFWIISIEGFGISILVDVVNVKYFIYTSNNFKAIPSCGRRDGPIVNTLDSGSSCPDSSPGRRHCVVFLGKTLDSHSASLHPDAQMGTGEFNGGPLGSYAEVTYLDVLKVTSFNYISSNMRAISSPKLNKS